MISLLQIGDVHLGARYGAFGDLASARRGAVEESFRNLPDVAGRLGVDAVLVAGDLFDRPRPESRLTVLVRETFRRLVETGRPVFAVPGNHDRLVPGGSPYDELPEGVTVFREPRFGDPCSVELAGGHLHVYGLAWDAAREPEPLATFRRSSAEGLHVVLLHAGVRDPSLPSSGHSLRVSRTQLAELGVDYIALGDYHRFRPPEEFAGLVACYSGSFAALDPDESGRRGLAHVRLEVGEPAAVTLIPSRVPEVVAVGSVDVSSCADEAEVAERVASAAGPRTDAEGIDRYPTATLEGTPSFPVDLDRVSLELAERFGFARVEDATRFYASDALRELTGRPTIVGHVARLGAARIAEATDEADRKLHEGALRLALRFLEATR